MPDYVILDTNVFIAAGFRGQSTSARLVQAVKDGRLRMFWNEATRREIEFIAGKVPRMPPDLLEGVFTAEGKFEGPTFPEEFDFIEDPDDRKFAALAAATGATVVSTDRHLLRAAGRPEFDVCAPHEFVMRLEF